MAMISTSNHDDLIDGFNIPFVESTNYLDMNYLGDIHTYVENDTLNEKIKLRIDDFIKHIKETKGKEFINIINELNISIISGNVSLPLLVPH